MKMNMKINMNNNEYCLASGIIETPDGNLIYDDGKRTISKEIIQSCMDYITLHFGERGRFYIELDSGLYLIHNPNGGFKLCFEPDDSNMKNYRFYTHIYSHISDIKDK